MTEQECRCERCGKLLGKITMIDGTKVIVETWCKNCKRVVSIVVRRSKAA